MSHRATVLQQSARPAARLWEIAENLHRAELTVAERAEHIAEWVRLTEAKAIPAQLAPKIAKDGSTRGRGETGASCASFRTRPGEKAQLAPLENKPHARGRPDQGVNAAVRELGIDRTEAQRAVKIAGLSQFRISPILGHPTFNSALRDAKEKSEPSVFSLIQLLMVE